MKLVSMKNAAENESEKSCEPCASPSWDKPEYPYGLRISLCEEDIKKLAMDALPAVGQELMLSAKVKVVSISSDETDKGQMRNIGLQITEMGFEGKKNPAEVAKKMYEKK